MPNRDFSVDQPGRWNKAFKPGLSRLSVYNVRKLHFHANICKAFAEDKSSIIVETQFYDGQFCKSLSSTISK